MGRWGWQPPVGVLVEGSLGRKERWESGPLEGLPLPRALSLPRSVSLASKMTGRGSEPEDLVGFLS